MNLIFLGPPGAGKGTQSARLQREFGVIQISTGDILRRNIKENTQLGKEAAKFINQGFLAPDEVINEMIRNELKFVDLDSGFLLDGFPRTVPQAIELDKIMAELNDKIDAVLVLEVPYDDLLQRLSGRRVCSQCAKSFHLQFNPPAKTNTCIAECEFQYLYQRKDDHEDAVANRLVVYENQTKPLIEYYEQKGMAYMIDGTGVLNQVFSRIKKILLQVLDTRLQNKT